MIIIAYILGLTILLWPVIVGLAVFFMFMALWNALLELFFGTGNSVDDSDYYE